MSNFDAKNELVRARQLKVETLRIPFTITGASSTQNVVTTTDEPAILFIQTQGTNRITVADGALATGESAPTYASPTDSTGAFAILVRVKETAVKAMSCTLTKRTANGVQSCSLANTTGITNGGDGFCFNATSSVDFTSGSNTLDACLEVSYIVTE